MELNSLESVSRRRLANMILFGQASAAAIARALSALPH
jgi:hypothetical protein